LHLFGLLITLPCSSSRLNFTVYIFLLLPRGSSPPSSILQTKHKPTYKLHKICQFGQFLFGKIIKIVAIIVAKIHLIRLGLRLCTRPPLGTSQRSPGPLSWILGGPTSKGKKKEEKEKTRKGKEEVKRGGARRKGTKEEKEGRRRETMPPN